MTATLPVSLPETTTHLHRLKSGIIIPATRGERTFVMERTMFPGYFDPDFVSYGTNVPSEPTPETFSDLYEMAESGNFRNVLGSLNTNLDLLFWKSQDQALTWVEKHPEDLHPEDLHPDDDWATFFPFFVGKKKFVANVCRHNRTLNVYVYYFTFSHVWSTQRRCRFVLPQLVVA